MRKELIKVVINCGHMPCSALLKGKIDKTSKKSQKSPGPWKPVVGSVPTCERRWEDIFVNLARLDDGIGVVLALIRCFAVGIQRSLTNLQRV